MQRVSILVSHQPLFQSLDHEDVNKHLEFSDRGCGDLFTPSFDHDVDPLVVDLRH